jgi:putative ATP-binding cassette transporter
MLFVPQRPYLPLGSLRAAISYPAPEGTFPDARIAEVMKLVGIGHLASRLDQAESWEQRLSVHEQQLLSLARVLLHEPEWLLLDDSTSGLSEALETKLYELLLTRLPRTAVVTIGARAGARALLPRHWSLVERRDGKVELEAA